MRSFLVFCLALWSCGCGGSDGPPPEFQVDIVNAGERPAFVETSPNGRNDWSLWGDWLPLPSWGGRLEFLPQGTHDFRASFDGEHWAVVTVLVRQGEDLHVEILPPGLTREPPEPDIHASMWVQVSSRVRDPIVAEWRRKGSATWYLFRPKPLAFTDEAQVQVEAGTVELRYGTREEFWEFSDVGEVSGDPGDSVLWVWS